MPAAIPESVLQETARWMVDFRDYWNDEVPTKIHSGDLGEGGSPEWHPDFSRWLGTDYYGRDRAWEDRSNSRTRTKRAFRKLRKKAIREFEVCYRIIVLGEPIRSTHEWLNDRAERNAIPLPDGQDKNYTLNDTLMLLVSGVGKLRNWW